MRKFVTFRGGKTTILRAIELCIICTRLSSVIYVFIFYWLAVKSHTLKDGNFLVFGLLKAHLGLFFLKLILEVLEVFP